ncbi:MAG: hypothetical protein LBI28_00920 [Treponema sp.]|jgi:orotate phosphoribosyltransferase|nr:hypothetical protein [Treponema sp.]
METQSFSISLPKNPSITVNLIPGHFTTNNAHTNNYLDVSVLKSNTAVARDVAREIAIPYLSTTLVDTIVCMEKMEVIGAYLAQELVQEGTSVINTGNIIHVISPLSNAYGNLVFPDSVTGRISGKNVLLLIATISSGRTLNGAMECIAYYGGKLAGISALYLASNVSVGAEIHPLFTSEDMPGYKLFPTSECQMCKSGQKLDAIISSEGYTRIE